MDAADPHHPHAHGEGYDHGHSHEHPAPPAPVDNGQFTPGEAKQARRLKMVLGLVGAFFVL